MIGDRSVQVIMKVEMANHEITIKSSHEVEEDWDVDEFAAHQVELTAMQMQSAINPCFIDHAYDINKAKDSNVE